MSAKLAKLEEFREGEYELPFGRVSVSRVDGGYRIVIYIDERAVGKAVATQMLQTLFASGRPV